MLKLRLGWLGLSLATNILLLKSYIETISSISIEGNDLCIVSNDGEDTYLYKFLLLIYSRHLRILTLENYGGGVIFISVPASTTAIRSLLQLLSRGTCKLDCNVSEIIKLVEIME